MKKCEFYRRQRGYVISEHVAIYFFGLLAIASLALPAYIYLAYGAYTLEDVLLILVSLFSIPSIFIGLMIFFEAKGSGRRKIFYRRFEQLSDAEKAEINYELSANPKFGHVHWGVNRAYIRATWLVEFVDYKNIVWIYPCHTWNVIASPDDPSSVVTHRITSLHLYDNEGVRYTIHNHSVAPTVEHIKRRSPNVIYGYCKKRARLAKKDFSRFKVEARNIE